MHEVNLFQPQSLKREFLISEYQRYYSEIREVNRMTLEYVKLFITLVSAVFIYSFGGFLYYENLKKAADGKFFFAYSLFGDLLLTVVIVITAYFFVELASSKKKKTRYWKLLDAVRGHIKSSYPDVASALPLPPNAHSAEMGKGDGPNLRNAEAFGSVAIGICAELIWLVVLVYFLTNTIDSIGAIQRGRLIKAISIANIALIAIALLTPFQLIRIRKMFKEARMITADNVYPSYPYGVHSVRTHYGAVILLGTAFMIVVALIQLKPLEFYEEWGNFGWALSIIAAFDLIFVALAFAFYFQKKLSSRAIFEYWKTNNTDPVAKWKRFIKLELSQPAPVSDHG